MTPAALLQLERNKIRAWTRRRIKSGAIPTRNACERCGKKERRRKGEWIKAKTVRGPRYVVLHVHHRDYANPLDIEWLCETCRNAHHQAEKKAKRMSQSVVHRQVIA